MKVLSDVEGEFKTDMKKKCAFDTSLQFFIIIILIGVLLGFASSVHARTASPFTDQAVSEAVRQELTFDEAIPGSRITVKNDNGVITLNGQVNNLLAKERAAEITAKVKGVIAIRNLIEVDPGKTITDKELTKDIKRVLLQNPATRKLGINVFAKDGKVSLEGEVDSFQKRRLVAMSVKQVRGVRKVDNLIQVIYEHKKTDEALRKEILQALHWDNRIDDALIEVRVTDGRVSLAGIVGSAAEKNWAIDKAYVTGVEAVDSSELQVERWRRDPDLKGDKYTPKKDSAILEAVKTALTSNPRIQSETVEVTVKNRTVILRGTIESLLAKKEASLEAAAIVGVREVKNHLKILQGKNMRDLEIGDAVVEALVLNPYTESLDVVVNVVDGEARLSGEVSNLFQKREVESVTSGVPGVASVINDLRVINPSPSKEQTGEVEPFILSANQDDRIKKEIEKQIFWSPFVDSDPISVTVKDGIATLSGTVNSRREYTAAEENAWQGGAVGVINKIVIDQQGATYFEEDGLKQDDK